ncbi:hypothetical protein KNP414_05631 [Paenibacillus mucilaginosus KNP414]|uniref:Uncharacterized protein n=1 Tax=Paenibacillus mucilaginosus (strain KNP414) TaxID=1036673 RepID=F8FLM8_PAEMK|nr:hypothetical protein KNP414_05631 [Paenibacillus mucilaginosus KNP414]
MLHGLTLLWVGYAFAMGLRAVCRNLEPVCLWIDVIFRERRAAPQ